MKWSQEKYIKALKFAAAAHGSQKVPDTDISYLFHINLVTMEIFAAISHEKGLDEELLIMSSILHDVLEDTDSTYSELLEHFGKNTADGVLALTKNPSLIKEKRIKESLERILNQPKEIWMVKLADRITNLREPPKSWSSEKKRDYLESSKVIYNTLKESSHYLSERLRKKIDEYRQYLGHPRL